LIKVYGPHVSVLYTSSTAQTSLQSQAHYFNQAFALQPNPLYELAYASTFVYSYLISLSPSNDIREAFARINEHEEKLSKVILEGLVELEGIGKVKIIGTREWKKERRAPTISFVVVGKESREVVGRFDQEGNVSGPELDLVQGGLRLMSCLVGNSLWTFLQS
jgi:selenocysteine lyase/cysteine desulfurase